METIDTVLYHHDSYNVKPYVYFPVGNTLRNADNSKLIGYVRDDLTAQLRQMINNELITALVKYADDMNDEQDLLYAMISKLSYGNILASDYLELDIENFILNIVAMCAIV